MRTESANTTAHVVAPRKWVKRNTLPDEVVKINLSQPLLILSSAELVLRDIELLHQRSLKARAPAFLLVTGQSGSGKSTLLETYEDGHPRETLDDRDRIPVLLFEVPAAPSISGIASQILAALGDPAAHKGTIGEKTERIYHLLDECGVEILLVDEFHNLLTEDRKRPIAKVTAWLKTFINRARRPVVACGLPRSKRVLNDNVELRRRFSAQRYLEPLALDNKGNGDEFRATLRDLAGRLPCTCIALHDKNVARRFIYATRGLIDYVVKILETAAIIAAGRPNQHIDLEVLGQAFVEKVWTDAPPKLNPFLTDHKLRILDKCGEPFDEWEDPRTIALAY